MPRTRRPAVQTTNRSPQLTVSPPWGRNVFGSHFPEDSSTAATGPPPAAISPPQAFSRSEELPARLARWIAAFRSRSSTSPQVTRGFWQRTVRPESVGSSSTRPQPEQVLLEGSQREVIVATTLPGTERGAHPAAPARTRSDACGDDDPRTRQALAAAESQLIAHDRMSTHCSAQGVARFNAMQVAAKG